MKKETYEVQVRENDIRSRIFTVRGVQVMLDRDLAELYGVETKVLNQAVKRNAERFPIGFMFRMTDDEWAGLRSQIVTSNHVTTAGKESLRLQIVTSKRGGARYRPYVFTEHGVVMLASVLKSRIAVRESIRVVGAFVAMRQMLASVAPVLSRVESVERRLIGVEDAQKKSDERICQIFDAMSEKSFPPQKVFYDGEFFDAFAQMKKFVRMAKNTLVVIDPYFDDSCLPLVAQKRPGVAVTVVVSKRGHRNLHAVDVAQFNKQYAHTLTVRESEKFHDRYLIIDNTTLIHVGASLNYLGKKCFAFSTLGADNIPDIRARVP